MVDGHPTYTDFIMNNPNGWPVDQAIGAYAMAPINGPLVSDRRYQEQMFALQMQRDAQTLWTIEGAEKYELPLLTPSPNESRELARIINEIDTFKAETEAKIILGTMPLNDSVWTNYVNTVKRMGIDRALEIQNAALARYKAR
jgi:putative aldouronate transport system substrate-binding protein